MTVSHLFHRESLIKLFFWRRTHKNQYFCFRVFLLAHINFTKCPRSCEQHPTRLTRFTVHPCVLRAAQGTRVSIRQKRVHDQGGPRRIRDFPRSCPRAAQGPLDNLDNLLSTSPMQVRTPPTSSAVNFFIAQAAGVKHVTYLVNNEHILSITAFLPSSTKLRLRIPHVISFQSAPCRVYRRRINIFSSTTSTSL